MNKLIKFGTVVILVLALVALNNSASASDKQCGNTELSCCKEIEVGNHTEDVNVSEEDLTEEEEYNETEDNRTYAALLEFLADDNTNENSFKSSKSCAMALEENLVNEGWGSKLEKATFKATGKTGKHLIRYCVGIETSDEGTVYIDSYSGKAGDGIDKRVTVLEAGKKWKAESADGICPHDQEGRYNRGKVLKVKIIEE
jgi:hypothetical protein